MKVLKFGGSSVANSQCIGKVCQLIATQATTTEVTVVLSAPKGVTDMLVEMTNTAHDGEDFQPAVEKMEQFMVSLIDDFGDKLGDGDKSQLLQLIGQRAAEISALLKGVKLLKFCPDHIRAQIICSGEYFSANIAKVLLVPFVMDMTCFFFSSYD